MAHAHSLIDDATERGQSLREVVIMTCSTLPGRTGARAHRRGMCGAECSRPRRAGWGRAGAGRRLDMGQTHPQFGRFYAPGRCAPSTPASRGSPCTSACLCIPGNRCAVCGGGGGGHPMCVNLPHTCSAGPMVILQAPANPAGRHNMRGRVAQSGCCLSRPPFWLARLVSGQRPA